MTIQDLKDPYIRYVKSYEFPQQYSEFGHPLCKWCGKESWNIDIQWCSLDCKIAYKSMMDSTYIKKLVRLRDKEVCSRCGVDLRKLRKDVFEALPVFLRLVVHYHLTEFPTMSINSAISSSKDFLLSFFMQKGFDLNTRYWWECDHILEVCRGGGCCGLENYQTLCLSCHRAKSNWLMRFLKIDGLRKTCPEYFALRESHENPDCFIEPFK